MNNQTRIKALLSSRMPLVFKALQSVHFIYLSNRSSRRAFSKIYRANYWYQSESISGPGSTLRATDHLRNFLPGVIREYQINSLLDAGCGDFNWMKEVELGSVNYIGVDVVESEIIERNHTLYGSENRHFMIKDIINDDLPKVDLILCRDCLTHLPNKKVLRALRQFKRSGSTYLMTTTHPNLSENEDTFTGGFRSLNLERPPFELPAPMMLFGDDAGESSAFGILGLWRLSEILPRTARSSF